MTTAPLHRLAAAAGLLALAAALLVAAPPAARAQSTPTLSIKDAQAFRPTTGNSTIAFEVEVTPQSGSDITVSYRTANGTAIAGRHYEHKDDSLTIPSNTSSGTITITLPTQTAQMGPDEDRTFTVHLSQPDGATIAKGIGQGTIYNARGPAITFKEGMRTVSEPPAGDTRKVTFTVQATGQSGTGPRAWGELAQVRYRTRDLTPAEVEELGDDKPAKAGVDYDAAEGVLTIQKPATGTDQVSEATIEVTVHGNDIYQGGQHTVFKLELFDPAFGVFLDNNNPTRDPEKTPLATGQIKDNDPPPTVRVGPVAVAEGNAGTTPAVLPITLSHRSTSPINLVHSTADGTATAADEDYVPVAPGAPVPTIPALATQASLAVHVKGDTKIEPNEHFFVDIATATPDDPHVRLHDDSKRVTVTILNDDGPYFTVTDVEGPQGDEGDITPFEFTVRLHQVPADWPHTVEVDYETVDGTARTDQPGFERYEPADGTLSFAPGETTKKVSVDVIGNDRPGFHQIFYVDLADVRIPDQPATTPPVPTLLKGRGVGTIFNDDGPELRVADAVVLRDRAALLDATFAVTLSEPLECPDWFHQLYGCDVLLEYRTVDGTAKAGQHYEAAQGTLRIPRGKTSAEIVVKVPGSAAPGPSYVFGLDLGMAELAQSMNRHATGEIRNHVGPELTVGDVALERPSRGTAQAVFPVTLAEKSSHDVTVVFATEDGTATAGSDYVGRAGTLEIPAGQTTGEVAVTVNPGAGPTRAFDLRLSQPAYAKLGTDTATATLEGLGGVPPPGEVVRSFGANRILTAVAISRDFFAGAEDVVLATAWNYPDALAAGALAAKLDAPLLLTDKEALPRAVRTEIGALGAERVWVMGGAAAVSQAVENALVADGLEVRRLAGADRFATAALVAAEVGAANGEVMLALGAHEVEHRAWPDALSAGALAASGDQLPTLLTRGSGLPAQTEQALAEMGATRVYVIGGSAAISDAVVAQLQALGLEVFRLSGPDRYATSVAVANEALRRSPPQRVPIVFATGHNFPDGLASAGLAARIEGVVLLVPPEDLAASPATGEFLPANGPKLGGGIVTGGSAAVSDIVLGQLRAALQASADADPEPEPGTETGEATP